MFIRCNSKKYIFKSNLIVQAGGHIMQKKRTVFYILLGVFTCIAYITDCFVNININLSKSNIAI